MVVIDGLGVVMTLENEVKAWVISACGEEYANEDYTEYVNAVKCFQHYNLPDEFTVEQILNKFVGKWENREAYVGEMLVEYGVEEKIQSINTPCSQIPMTLECLDYEYVWQSMSQRETALKGWVNVWSESNPDFDHYFYVYNMTR